MKELEFTELEKIVGGNILDAYKEFYRHPRGFIPNPVDPLLRIM